MIIDAPPLREDVRDLFPYTRARVYLDTAAAGLCWRGHGAAVARFYDAVKSRGFDARPEWLQATARLRARLAAWLGVQAGDVTLVSNTTEAMNLAAHSIRFAPGERVVLAADEFPSVQRVWAPARAAGAQIVALPIAEEAHRQAALLQAVTDGTKVLAVSHVHWTTGTRVDLDALARHCRERGTLLVVDGIQALGAVPTQLDGVDVYATSFFKWMLSGFGIGVLITSERARAAMTPAFQGYANADDARQLQYAHVNMPAVYGLHATLDVLESIQWTTIFGRVQALATALHRGAEQLGLQVITPKAAHAGIVAVRARDPEACRIELDRRGISVSSRGDGVRISPHFYNTADDIERCLKALADVLPAH